MGKNPFDPANFTKGGGLWDDKIVTVLSCKAKLDKLTYGDGSPVLNEKGEQSIRNVVEIVGIADEDEAERRETYSMGALIPTGDGEGFTRPDGTPGSFHENSEAAKFSRALQAAGFPIENLWDEAAQKGKLSGLVNARLRMKGEARKDKDGNDKKNKKGYVEQKFYPVEFLGYRTGAAAVSATPGAAAKDRAVEVVMDILTAAEGVKITRAELIRKVSVKLTGDPDANKVLALISRADFHKDAPWQQDATGAYFV